jgi:hypothetical protein
MRGKITKRSVDALKPATDGTEAMLWDTELKGFGVRVQGGCAKSYILHYRAGTGRTAPLRKLTIGRHGSPWTPDTARREAKRLLGMVENGADPAGDKMARKAAPTMAEFAERFLAEHAVAKRKASTAAEYGRLMDKIILPRLGKRKLADIARSDITRLHHANRTAPYQANRVLAVLSKMFNIAERWGLRPDGSNPCRHVEKYAERKRERMLSPAELARLGDALRPMTARPMPPPRSSCSSSPARGSAKCWGCAGDGSISSGGRRAFPIARPAPKHCTCHPQPWPSSPSYHGSTATRT